MRHCGFPAALATALMACLAMAPAQAAGSLCQAPEQVLFTCPIDSKTVSVCGGGQHPAVYRFGRPGQVEIEIPGVHYASTGFSGGGETQVQADTPTHRYIIYAETHRTAFGTDGRHDPQSSSGLFVQTGGRTVLSRQCATHADFDPQAEALLPAGTYAPH